MISVVCVYNNESLLKDYLLNSLENQTVEFELIKIDNTRNRFRSAAEALNDGGKRAKGKYIMFVHQDVRLSSNSWLEDAEKILDYLPKLGIAGVAGAKKTGNPKKLEVVTNVKHGIPPRNASYNLIKNPVEVETLDECLVIIPKPMFDTIMFDEKVCDDWHLYAVDYCLSVRKLGYFAYAIPLFVYHLSEGALFTNYFKIILSFGEFSKKYYQNLEKIRNKHKMCYDRICTPCGIWDTSYPVILQRVLRSAKLGLNPISKRIVILRKRCVRNL